MDKNKHFFCCRVCGFDQGFKPWGEDESTPSFDICGCCGVQFGYQDCSNELIRSFRKRWLKTGGQWHIPEEKPPNWNLEEQLKNIPEEYK